MFLRTITPSTLKGLGTVSNTHGKDEMSIAPRSSPHQVSNETLSLRENTGDEVFSSSEADALTGDTLEDQSTIPEDIMIKVFGFDPRKSPFTVNGYPLLPAMKDSLNHLYLPLVDRKHLQYLRRDDGLFECVGQGSFGCVFVAALNGRSNKVVVKDYVTEHVSLEMIEHEARLHKYLTDTDFVPDFVGLVKSAASNAGYSFVQEYFGDGLTIHKLLISKDNLSNVTWMQICCQLAVGLESIHAKHVLLNDIKSDNVLVDLKSGIPKVKYIDMGMATYREGLRFEALHSQEDRFRYLAPEVCMGSYTSPLSDIYSLGHLLGQIGRKSNISGLVSVSEDCLTDLPVGRISLVVIKTRLLDILMATELEDSDVMK